MGTRTWCVDAVSSGRSRPYLGRTERGEGYLPLVNDDRRARARAITKDVVDQFGKVSWNACGGYCFSGEIVASGRSASPATGAAGEVVGWAPQRRRRLRVRLTWSAALTSRRAPPPKR